jgi:hypothetical protein
MGANWRTFPVLNNQLASGSGTEDFRWEIDQLQVKRQGYPVEHECVTLDHNYIR